MKVMQITEENFTETSLDGFIRTQIVHEVWRKIDNTYKLITLPFTDDWSAERKKEKAKELLDKSFIAYGAFEGKRVIGFIMLKKELVGNRMIVDSFHVSQDCRRNGIGKALFEIAKEEGRKAGADKLYISACSSKETIAFYHAMGCKLTNEIISEMAKDEPYDLQLECKLYNCAPL